MLKAVKTHGTNDNAKRSIWAPTTLRKHLEENLEDEMLDKQQKQGEQRRKRRTRAKKEEKTADAPVGVLITVCSW